MAKNIIHKNSCGMYLSIPDLTKEQLVELLTKKQVTTWCYTTHRPVIVTGTVISDILQISLFNYPRLEV